jgi:hypothetical protein
MSLETIIVKINENAIQDMLANVILDIARKTAIRAEEIAPVDTGLMRSRIAYTRPSEKDTVTIGAYTRYSGFVHDGTGTNYRKVPRPFLKNALNDVLNTENIKKYIGE